MIDSHCHLTAKEFESDRNEVMERAVSEGVERIFVIADTLEEAEQGIVLAEMHPGILFCTAGVHPHHASSWKPGDLGKLRQLAGHSLVKAIGEIGLDYHYNFTPPAKQREVFETQLQLAQELDLPAVLHCREAIEDTWNIVTKVKLRKLVLHCCTEKFQDVQKFIEAGYLLSFTGIATYPKSAEIRETIRQCPMDQLLLETDAPYLPPEALRAKGGRRVRNEPAYVVEVAKCVAKVKGMTLEEVDHRTTANARRFFGIS